MSSGDLFGDLEPDAHLVQFRQADDLGLAHNVSRYLAEGWARGDDLVVIATPQHRRQIQRLLAREVIDWDAAIQTRRLTVLDAKETLDRITIGGQPDWELCKKVIEDAVAHRAPPTQNRLRIYVEMVGVLWALGQRDHAMLLEVYWNRRNGLPGLNLLCGYPIDLWSEEIVAPTPDALLSQHPRLASTGWRENLEIALDKAVGEGLGPEASRATAPKIWADDSSMEMPRAEATILWLWATVPDRAAQILTRARQYFTEFRSEGLPAPESALKPFFDQLSSLERDALTRFYVRGESPSKIQAATGIRESELRQLRVRARAFYRETLH